MSKFVVKQLKEASWKRDPLFRSWFVHRLINSMPLKSRARNRSLVYGAFSALSSMPCAPSVLLGLILHSIRPRVWVRVVRRWRGDHRVPYRLTTLQQYRRSVRWLSRAFKLNKAISPRSRLTTELRALFAGDSIVYGWNRQLCYHVWRNKHNAKNRRY